MFKKDRRTASVNKTGFVVVTYDNGWEDLVDTKQQFASEADGKAWILAQGYVEYDPNAELKARGLKWNGYCYA